MPVLSNKHRRQAGLPSPASAPLNVVNAGRGRSRGETVGNQGYQRPYDLHGLIPLLAQGDLGEAEFLQRLRRAEGGLLLQGLTLWSTRLASASLLPGIPPLAVFCPQSAKAYPRTTFWRSAEVSAELMLQTDGWSRGLRQPSWWLKPRTPRILVQRL
ncbi:unnamed protein product [Polarella glacialis]|uniref:Uncharacterized protein n=1 Tax=Polarella glacialis TaxID=89957 RepID=A0A813DE15_POLGL|nr:unnamed protein product [Polarella glacialis]